LKAALYFDIKPENGEDEPMIGYVLLYVILAHSQTAVDMLGHRLIQAKRMDLKGGR